MTRLRTCEVRQLLHNKFVVVMGDSIQRVVYKDLVLLLQKDCLLSAHQLKAKGEPSFEHDVLLEGSRQDSEHNSIYYREVRQFQTGHHLVRFYFLTRAYSAYLEDVLAELRRGEHAPDLLVLNSCLWDLSRHGRHFHNRYRDDLACLFRRMECVLPASCLLVWNTALPVADRVAGGCLPPRALARLDFLRQDVMEANFYSAVEAARRGFDLLDLHFHFRHAERHQLRDGVHWDERAHRRLSQLLLAHVADAWGVNLPGHHRAADGDRDPDRDGRRRDDPTRRRPAAELHRQPRDGRGDPRESAAPWRPEPPARPRGSPRPLAMRSSRYPASDLSYREGARTPSDLHPRHPPSCSNSSRRQVEWSRGANWRVDRERMPGSQHPRRELSPYPARSPGGSPERHGHGHRHRHHHGRHSSRQA